MSPILSQVLARVNSYAKASALPYEGTEDSKMILPLFDVRNDNSIKQAILSNYRLGCQWAAVGQGKLFTLTFPSFTMFGDRRNCEMKIVASTSDALDVQSPAILNPHLKAGFCVSTGTIL